MLNNKGLISIADNNCEDCFRCVRECSVKAINSSLSHMSIDVSKCILCGDCIDVCPLDLIKLESHISRVKRLIKKNHTIIASISPNWITEFKDIESYRMIEAMRLIGFTYVSETAIGATIVKRATAQIMDSSDTFLLSNSCPAATRLIETTYPSLIPYIVPLVHPTVAHARFLKHKYGSDAIVVAVDSCSATRGLTHDFPKDLDAVLTFSELRELMDSEGVKFDLIPGSKTYKFAPFEAKGDNMYVVPRGMYNHNFLKEFNLKRSSTYNFSGVSVISNILESLSSEKINKNAKGSLVELFACNGGCLYGAGNIDSLNIISKQISMSRYDVPSGEYSATDLPWLDLKANFKEVKSEGRVDQLSINQALESLFMTGGEDLLNCGGCGYGSCESFAEALAKGQTRKDLCLYYQKQLAQNKFTQLINCLQSSVAVVGSDMKIIEVNKNFAELLGAESEMMYDRNPGLKGVDITTLFTFHEYISQALSEADFKQPERDIQVKDRFIRLNVFKIERGNMVCVIARNLFASDIRSNDIIERTQQVINENLETVQKIAYLLGENASKTEAMLNSIIESERVLNDR